MTDEPRDPDLLKAFEQSRGPHAGAALARTVAAARAGARAGRATRLRSWLAAGLVAVALVGLTPPGQSLAEAIGELAGVGDEPTEPELRGGFGSNRAVVIGTGTSPNGTPYEVVAAHASDPEFGMEGITQDGPISVNGGRDRASYEDDCAGLSVPGGDERTPLETVTQRLCLTPELYSALEDNPITLSVTSETDLTDGPALRMSGFALGPAQDVRLELRTEAGTQTIEPEVYELDDELAAQIGAASPFRFYVAFVPVAGEDLSGLLGSAKAVALDADGAVMSESSITTGVVYAAAGGEIRNADGEPVPTRDVRRCLAAASDPAEATIEERKNAVESALSGGFECIHEVQLDADGKVDAFRVTGP